MARVVSFVVLIVILLLIAGLFFQVMANFLLPVFLAVLLVVMFRPLNDWFLSRCGRHHRMAATLTTTTILLIFLIPLLVLIFQAVSESASFYRELKAQEIDLGRISQITVRLGSQLGLQLDATDVQTTITERIQQWLTPVALYTTQFLGSLAVGLVVMVISVYYFLADGPAMIQAIMRVSPVDDRYKQQLAEQFINVTRAVVLATLLSAIAQGILAGIGYWLAGFDAIFLLMVLTMLFSMVPFVGPPAVWAPACLWLYFYEDRTAAAVGLAIYGLIIVSTVDNIIKPLVLHGRSNLHPLLALLSVLGGVQALGPIGIFVGPMAVAFLQTLLNILHGELEVMTANRTAEPVLQSPVER